MLLRSVIYIGLIYILKVREYKDYKSLKYRLAMMHSFSISNEINKSPRNFFCMANNVIEWYGTPPYCGILMIKISNKISHKLIKIFFPKIFAQ